MRRRSERGKTKPIPKEDSPDKTSTRKSNRHSRRRRKSSSSSDSESNSPKKEIDSISQPLLVQVQDIELPQGENPVPVLSNNKNEEKQQQLDGPQKDWKEDNAFWESGDQKSTQDVSVEGNSKEKEENSLWKVQSANGGKGGGEIQKLKICRQRPTESPELGEASLPKRLGRGTKDGRSTDDSTHEESEKETKKTKHRTRTSSRNSPMVSPSIVCDMSEVSPTKIKIINVNLINTDNKGGQIEKTPTDETVKEENQELKKSQDQETMQNDETINISLPADKVPPQKPGEEENKEPKEQITEAKEETQLTDIPPPKNDTYKSHVGEVKQIDDSKPSESMKEEDSQKTSLGKLKSSSSSPNKDSAKSPSSRSSSAESDSSNKQLKPRKVKKKRRRELQSSVQRKLRTSPSPKHESSDSEDEKKREDERRLSLDIDDTKAVNDKENEANNSLPNKDIDVADYIGKDEQVKRPMARKRRWGSSKANHPNKKPILSISTDSLKVLIPDAKPIPAEELQLSVEEEEGQLDDDDEEDEVVALVAKEEEKQLEHERQREERQKVKELERRKRQERLERKSEQPTSLSTSDKGAVPRKILLLSDDAKKLARSPSPPRRKPTSVLFITHLVRPFTVQQLKNLLLRTGTIAENGFWIDKIKSKCYVEYTTEDAAVETRHALHGVRWPTSNPKTLIVEFASHDDLVIAQTLSEEPEVPRKAEPLTMVEGWVAEQARMKERNRRAVREWDVGKPEYPDEVLEFDLKLKEKKEQERKIRKERPHRSATPEGEPPARKSRKKEDDAPAKLLDDLFRKTKTSPCIYWLPLTQDQISVKEEMRRQHMAEHERRMAELKKAELARRDRERRPRK